MGAAPAVRHSASAGSGWPFRSLASIFHGGPFLRTARLSRMEASDPRSLLGKVDDAVAASGREREDAQRRLEEARLALEVWERVQDDLRAGHYADALLAIKETGDPPVVLDGSHSHRDLAEALRTTLDANAREATT